MTLGRRLIWALVPMAVLALLLPGWRGLWRPVVAFGTPAHDVEAFDFIEIVANVSPPRVANPFVDAAIHGTFRALRDHREWQVDGFCDADNGSVYRVRFMPPTPGEYEYTAEFRQGWWRQRSTGTFQVKNGNRKGVLRLDPLSRWHFVWEATGEHYFFNGTTAYWLMGWRDDRVINASIDRLHRLKINRLRVTVAGRTNSFYGEPVVPGENWTPYLMPWPAAAGQKFLHYLGRLGQRIPGNPARGVFDSIAEFGLADDVYHPGFDYERFRVEYWQKFERALRFARERDMIFSLVLDMNDSKVHPAPGSADERRFIQYAVARFSAFSNITWDLGDDLDQYRGDRWTRTTGELIKRLDPYAHLATSHPTDNEHQDRGADWFDFTSFQEWSRMQHTFMLDQRRRQRAVGRIIPQTNEEYGYEDHYPLWAAGYGSDAADVLRRTAWDIVMAGGYQTTGETARRGTNIWPDTGGGWMNGRGDDSMQMLLGYAHMVEFFTSFEWWKTEPHDELVDRGDYCLADPGRIYVIYLPHAGGVSVQLQPGRYRVSSWDAAKGTRTTLAPVMAAGGPVELTTPDGPDDTALLLVRE